MLVHAEPLLDVPLYEIRPRLAEPLSVPVEPPQGGSVDPRWQGGFPRAGHGAQCITTCSAVLQTLLAGAIGRDAHRLSRSADAPPPMNDQSTAEAWLRGPDLRERPRSAARARYLACRSRDGPAEALDRCDRHSRGETSEADRGLGPAVGAEDRAPDAHDPLGRLLLIDGVPAAPDRSELALKSGELRDAEVQTPTVSLGRGGNEPAALEHL